LGTGSILLGNGGVLLGTGTLRRVWLCTLE
jgi:hypothetical protein